MDKVLYFRSSSDPLILTEEQRGVRRKSRRVSSDISTTERSSLDSDRIDSLKKTSDILVVRGRTLPDLASTASNRIKHANSRHELGKQPRDSSD